MNESTNDGEFPWQLGVFDAHCHPTDTLSSLPTMPGMRAKVLTIMATRAQDQQLVANAADKYGISENDAVRIDMDWSAEQKIIPSFGWHPWFSHQMFDENDYDGAHSLSSKQKAAHYQSVLMPRSEDLDFLHSLPEPRPLSHFIDQTKTYLQRYQLALVGEIGLDRSFRIPEAWLPEQAEERNDALTPGGREGRRLSPYRVSMAHQRKVLLAQLHLAGEMRRAVSVHGVQAHGLVFETLAQTWKGHEIRQLSKRDRKNEAHVAARESDDRIDDEDAGVARDEQMPYPPRVCLHSFSGPAETVKQYVDPSVPCKVFFSFSTTINAWSENGDGKVEATVRAVPDDRILIESDLHKAGEAMDNYLEEAVRKVCGVKGWEIDNGVRQLGDNWKHFVFGQI